jgi:CRP-like cAMP-binding protein
MALNDHMRQLRQIPLFAALNDEALRLIAFSAGTRIVQQGEALFREGEESDAGYLVLSGRLDFTREGGVGVTHAGAGALVGEMALIAPTQRPATATAAEITGVLIITRALFLRVLTEFPDCAVQMRRDLAARVAAQAEAFEAFRAGFAPA